MAAVTITVQKSDNVVLGSDTYVIDDATNLGILLFLPVSPGGVIK